MGLDSAGSDQSIRIARHGDKPRCPDTLAKAEILQRGRDICVPYGEFAWAACSASG